MSDQILLQLDQLRLVLDALERIPRRFAKIKSPNDFVSTQSGIDLMDSICMVLLAAGEEFKKIECTLAIFCYEEYNENYIF